VQEALAAIEQDTGGALRSSEVYPDPDRPVRLPYGDCLTITDEWLNKAGAVDLKANAVRRMDFYGDRRAVKEHPSKKHTDEESSRVRKRMGVRNPLSIYILGKILSVPMGHPRVPPLGRGFRCLHGRQQHS
jgi:hypothetical protein